tara:strand:+ start:3810 stop:3974 length:165 start_codon:yes stop_codon:yes gene_type:complete
MGQETRHSLAKSRFTKTAIGNAKTAFAIMIAVSPFLRSNVSNIGVTLFKSSCVV